MANKQKALMWVMFLIILILVIIIVYAFVISPTITGYVVERQLEGYQIALSDIIFQIQQDGFVQIPLGEDESGEMQSLFLIPFDPQQLNQPQG